MKIERLRILFFGKVFDEVFCGHTDHGQKTYPERAFLLLSKRKHLLESKFSKIMRWKENSKRYPLSRKIFCFRKTLPP